ncbi:protease inhibitor I42 family protein [Nocardia mangyaensis]|uniref:protease inhibitor I42 family protein n=1 Tax=Nocardia mangyaensis TaxID=2213200 RepID=UPI002676EDED|nr:protease inhibitor I42 family protein [Nocardia mangyaensis]MDO3645797.1 protease inhibitor I42 family protein [Nocardia mangyaensis]
MRRSSLVLVAVAAVGGLLTGCGADDDSADTDVVITTSVTTPQSAAGPMTIDQSANGSTVELIVGQRLVVRLPQDPAATEQWGMVNEAEGVLIADGGPESEGNTTEWPFRAIEQGVATLEFVYAPAGEPPVEPDPTFVVDVRVS